MAKSNKQKSRPMDGIFAQGMILSGGRMTEK